MIMLTAVCTVAAFVIFFKLIAAIGPMNATLITYVNPVVAVILGVLILNEPLTPGLMIGMPLVLGGSWLAARG
jgi:drug/metabolite transporter (DMT)-like permease